MTDLRTVLINTDLVGTPLDEGRRRTLLKQLEGALGSAALVVNEDDLAQLQDRLRISLKNRGAPPATVRNQVSRLGVLLRAATAQGLLAAPAVFDPGFPTLVRPSSPGPPRRKYRALVAFRERCAVERVRFDEVRQDTFRNYREYLLEPTRRHGRARAEVLYADLVAAWREQQEAGRFPALDLPRWNEDSKSLYGLPRRQWPRRIEEDFARLERGAMNSARPGEDRWRGPLRETSLKAYRKRLEQLLGYVANIQQTDLSDVGLAEVLGTPTNVIGFVEWHRDDRCGGEERAYHRDWLDGFAVLLEWLGSGEATPDRYRRAASSLVPKRVRDPFPARPIDYSELADAAVTACSAALQRWRSLTAEDGLAVRIQAACELRDAVCLATLVCRPMRSRNLREMKLGENLVSTPEGKWRLQFQDHEMKTKQYSCEFPPQVADALEVYLAETRPLLAARTGTSLAFPTKSGKSLGESDLWRRMVAIGSRYLNLRTNPHMFRYLIPCAYLLRHPDRLVEVQALLGHSNLAITLRRYVRVYSQVASRRVAELQRANCPSLRRIGELLPAPISN